MANTTEMLRLMRHASKRLREEQEQMVGHGDRSLIAALAYGSAVLDMVAACMDDEPTPQLPNGQVTPVQDSSQSDTDRETHVRPDVAEDIAQAIEQHSIDTCRNSTGHVVDGIGHSRLGEAARIARQHAQTPLDSKEQP